MITMRSLTITSDGADVFVIYVMEIDVNIVWPMDFSRSSFCITDGLALALLRFPFDTNHIEFKLSAFTFHDYKVGYSEYPSKTPFVYIYKTFHQTGSLSDKQQRQPRLSDKQGKNSRLQDCCLLLEVNL